ncbi:protein pangolin, isoforms A/H/I/S-like isoform X3 [Frankliniella occidentalis]|uniref:dTCF n=1 Tax=Frankliniella occidentalis TaxID=133901 RepID=A0A9C6X013_FRAOC|nr:protein pangolin, isoforms A/H/I/S-like isoform X3 [Frankliniella occidentalis]
MPHVSSGGGGDDLGSTDEVKVFKDEGEDEKRSENLTEEKSSLIDLTESEEKGGGGQPYSGKHAARPDLSPVYGKLEPTPHSSSFNMGYLVSPYPYHNGAAGPIPVSMASKMGLAGPHPFFCPGGDLGQPPPAHMGIPPYQLDPKGPGEYWLQRGLGAGPGLGHGLGHGLGPAHWKRLGPLLAASGLTRAPMYPFSPAQYPYPMLSPEMSQVAASWFSPTGLLPAHHHHHHHPGLGSPHGPPGHPGHPGHHPLSHPLSSNPAVVTPGPKQDLQQHQGDHNHRSIMDHQKNSGSNSDNSKGQDSGNNSNNQDKKKPHIKKPLNAFMLYMKEMRQQVVSECTLKESAAINQILGRRWHSLSREEQGKYYEKARQERQLHMQLYPAWSARDNYGYGAKKKKRKKERVPVDTGGGNNMKKCRARYGLDQQSQWCKPCRRKKKCIRYMEAGGGGGGDDGNQSDDNLGSCGSVGDGDAHTPVDDDDDDDDGDESMSQSHSLSSPGGLSGLSSLTSPSMILPSPSTSLASPSVSLASPCMSLQSPLTPLEYECKPPPLPLPLPLPMYNHHSAILGPPLHRHPVGTNPHDINNPLSVNQLTGKCNKTETISSASSGGSGGPNGQGPGPSAPAPAPSNIIRVT